MTLFLNLVLVVVLVLSVVLFNAMRKVSAEAAASVSAGEMTEADKQLVGGHRMWANLSAVLVVLVLVGFFLINR